jgi:hypothetical protein
MGPILNFVLPALGICRNFPCYIVHAPKEYFGPAIKHLHTIQEIARIRDIIQHTFQNSITGLLYRGSLELLHIELGLMDQLHTIDFDTMSVITTDSLVKTTWQFSWKEQIELHTDLQQALPRTKDRLIMRAILDMRPSLEDLRAINKCGLFLRALFLSDITDGSGTNILQEAWICSERLHLYRTQNWPDYPKPSQSQAEVRQSYLKRCFLGRGRRLRQLSCFYNRAQQQSFAC